MGVDRICPACKKTIIWNRPDPCLGILPGVKNACCGHGDPSQAYVHFETGQIIRGINGFDHAPILAFGDPEPTRLVVRCTKHGPMISVPNPWAPFPDRLAVECHKCKKEAI